MAPTLTVSQDTVVLHGVAPATLQGPVLPPGAMQTFAAVLTARGFDLTRPVYVRELPDLRGFRFAQ
jgi:hypothetical protein